MYLKTIQKQLFWKELRELTGEPSSAGFASRKCWTWSTFSRTKACAKERQKNKPQLSLKQAVEPPGERPIFFMA